MPFDPKFADLARNAASVEGTGPAALGAAVPGFASIADSVGAGEQFYYSLHNVEVPDEREVGRGTMLAGGAVEREPIDGEATDFTAGTKIIALVAAAEWYARVDEATSPASAAEIRAGSEPARPIAPAPLFAAAAPVPLGGGGLVRPDFDAGINFNLTLSADTVLDSPVGAKPGQSGRVRVTQDSAGGRSLAFGPAWQFAGPAPQVSSAPGAADVIAYFVNSDGAVEATLAKGLAVRPIPLSVSDFKNGLYSVGGEAASFADLWQQHPGEDFIEGSVIAGEGWKTSSNTLTNNSLQATAAHLAALGGELGSGLTMVADYYLAQPSSTKPRIVLSVEDYPDYAMGWHYYQNGSTYIWLYDYGNPAASSQLEVPGPLGDQKVAVTLSDVALQYSRNGNAVLTVPADPQAGPANSVSIHCYTSHDSTGTPAVALLRSVVIYPKLAASELPLLSA
jgi:hypothetical protein